MGHGLASITTAWAGLALTWFVQSSVLLAFGLVLGRLFKQYGPAVQSVLYRTTLLAVMVCPLASGLLARAGFEGLVIRFSPPARGGTVRQPAIAPAPVLAAESPVPEPTLATEPASPASALGVPAISPIEPPVWPVAVTERNGFRTTLPGRISWLHCRPGSYLPGLRALCAWPRIVWLGRGA